MQRTEFFITRDGGTWTVTSGTSDYALLPSKRRAIDAALAAAHFSARSGKHAQVLLRNHKTGEMRALWTSGLDVYPP